jgi:xanthosine utilization system XapX-like protein
MPLITRWKRLGFAGQLVALVSFLLVVVAGMVVALVALVTATDAGAQAKTTAECVNSVLGDRNGPSARDAAAHIAFAKADKRFSDTLAAVLILPNGSQAQRDAYDEFVVASRQKKEAARVYTRVLVADQKARDAKPLGEC